jgi:hypothetical protein
VDGTHNIHIDTCLRHTIVVDCQYNAEVVLRVIEVEFLSRTIAFVSVV